MCGKLKEHKLTRMQINEVPLKHSYLHFEFDYEIRILIIFAETV